MIMAMMHSLLSDFQTLCIPLGRLLAGHMGIMEFIKSCGRGEAEIWRTMIQVRVSKMPNTKKGLVEWLKV
jgi:hypothetical protein